MHLQILLFWRDLRLDDNQALEAAHSLGPVLPVFLTSELADLGHAQHWWLAKSLAALDQDLQLLGNGLWLLDDRRQLLALALQHQAEIHLCQPLDHVGQDLVQQLSAQGTKVSCYQGNTLLDEPLLNQQQKGYQVFTPFWKQALQQIALGPLVDTPACLPAWPAPPVKPDADTQLADMMPSVNWYDEFGAHFTPGERGAELKLSEFLSQDVQQYPTTRDQPAIAGTARLSPHLRFGELSIRRVVQRLLSLGYRWEFDLVWLRELGWREFAHHSYRLHPQLAKHPLQQKFAHFPWQQNPDWLAAWQQGQTGVPIVDAGMRELWRTGWMHNRVRMVVGSYLVKNLRLPWQLGLQWFDDCLLDADPAVNAMSWQWIAGCGADAAPYFRIFNPVSQAERFDPEGRYLARMVPELASLPAKWQRQPWLLPGLAAQQLGFRLGDDYPHPLVDLKVSRESALVAFKSLQGLASEG